MKITILLKGLFFICISAVLSSPAYSYEYPKPTGYFNDFALVLTKEEGASLNKELIAFEKKTTIEIAVVTVTTLNGKSIESYTRGLAEAWGVGKRSKNNGVVFLIAPKERKMRIETASGIRSILTDSRAGKIRDETILPLFKAGKMAKGIVDGTHAIMSFLDANLSSQDNARTAPASRSKTQEWTDKDTEILLYCAGSAIGIGLLLFLIVPPIRRSRARKYVLENKDKFAGELAKAESESANSDVSEQTHKEFLQIKDKFSLINGLAIADKKVDWIKVREELNSLTYSLLPETVRHMKNEIAFAERARKEGPELMEKIPALIKAAEKKISEGRQSEEAAEHLANAKRQYAEAQRQESGMAITDWIILYVILSNVLSDCKSAESVHNYVNTDHSESESDHESGDSGGFGGGSGFDGGGCSGDW